MSNLEPREELASIAASLRAYLEQQRDTGSSGIPRRPRARAAAAHDIASQDAGPALRVGVTGPARDIASQDAGAALRVDPTDSARAPTTPTAPAAPRPLPVLKETVASCALCELHATRKNAVFERGSREAKLCFVGEAPGADEDAQGIPFVGRAGQLLDKMIGAMGLDPDKDVYVCNIIKCRPPGNRRPEPDEVATCIPYLHEQIAAVDPKVIVALGNTSVAALIGTKIGITRLRGSWKLYRGRIPVMPTYHPSYLLRPSPQQTEAKRQAWEDLQAVMRELGLSRPAR